MKKLEIKVTTYEAERGFMVDILELPKSMEAWIYHKSCGIKSMMFGTTYEQNTMDEFLNVIEGSLEEEMDYYQEQYMDGDFQLYVADTDTGTFIEEVSSVEEGLEVIARFEAEDRENECFEESFYEIVNQDHCRVC